MRLRDIAIKNVLRRKSRAVLVIIGIVAGTGSVVAVTKYTSAMTDQINHAMDKYGANIIITPKSSALELKYGGFNAGGVSYGKSELTVESLKNIGEIKNAANIAATSPVLIGAVKINGVDVLSAGMDFTKVAVIKPWWKLNGEYPEEMGIITGIKAGRILGLNMGDTVIINKRKLTVTGFIEETGSQDDSMVFMKLDTAQSILGKRGKISMVEIAALCNACPVEEMVTQISGKMPDAEVKALQQVVAGRINTIGQIKNVSITLSFIIMAIGILVVFVTMMSNVRERRGEIGIMRAVGFRKSHVISIIFIETAVLSLIGGIAGYICGSLSAWVIARFASGGEHLVIHSSAEGVFAAVALSLTAGLVAGIYPAIAASNLDPVDALKSI